MNDEQFVQLPCVSIPTGGLEDRIRSFQKRQDFENGLSKIVRGDDEVAPTPLKERMTVDPVAWKFFPETRVYHGDRATTVRKGRRPFAGILQSRIEETLNQF
jgi:hypothetical protein